MSQRRGLSVRTASLVLAAAAVTGVVAGCGGSDNAEAADPKPVTQSADPTPATQSAEPTPASESADPQTDEELAIGTTADIDYFPPAGSEPIGSGTVTVTAVRKGSVDDLKGAGYSLKPEQEATTPYYVDMSFTNGGTAAVEPAPPFGVDSTNTSYLPLILLDLGGVGFKPCPGLPDTVKPGRKAAGCAIVMIPNGNTLEQIKYLPDSSADYVFWKAK